MAAESGVIRIARHCLHRYKKTTYIAGIYGVSVTGSPVYIASNGQLGTVVSSERFKTAIARWVQTLRSSGSLRPVTFHLKTDPKGALQYGLIAEESSQGVSGAGDPGSNREDRRRAL